MNTVINKVLKITSASVIAVAVSMPMTETAQAQNLFDFLFGGQQKRLNRYPEPPPPKRIVKRKKIKAPSFYTYKPDPMVKVGFEATLAALAAAQTIVPAAAHDTAPTTVETEDDPNLSTGAITAERSILSDFALSMDSLNSIELKTTKTIAKALDEHYSANPDFIWVTGEFANSRAREAIETLAAAETYGLDPQDYAVELPSATFSLDDLDMRRAELMKFEMALSARVLRYVSDAKRGRINPNRLSGYHDLPLQPLDFAKTLSQISRTQEIATFLETRHPGSEQYTALKNELAELRSSQENAIVINDLKLLKPGQSHPEFAKVLQIIQKNSPEAVQIEFGDLLAANAGAETYTKELVPLIKAAQKAGGTKPDGIIGRNTIKAFFGESKQSKIDRVVLAMERMRWLPPKLGDRRVFINQPAFEASYFEQGREKLSMRVVVGKRSNQTSFFYDEIETIDYNPYWGVPQSILINEMLPKLYKDPSYLDRAGYEITTASGKRVSSSSIDWYGISNRVPYNVRQKPGARNALGELKILFPNKHAIYMHDTPAKNLFSRESRAFSHGCIRLQKPRAMAAAVLGKTEGHVATKISQGHSTERVPGNIPVYISYFTAWPKADGSIGYYHDMYGRDAHLLKSIAIVDELRDKS